MARSKPKRKKNKGVAIENNSQKKTKLVDACKDKGGSFYWIQQVDKNGIVVGPDNIKPKPEAKTQIKEKIIK